MSLEEKLKRLENHLGTIKLILVGNTVLNVITIILILFLLVRLA